MASSSQPEEISLFNDPILSDVKIRQIYTGKVKEYFAHKAILAAHSKWFLKAVTGRFKVFSPSASSNRSLLSHCLRKLLSKSSKCTMMTPKNFEYMLKFLYTNKLAALSIKNSKDNKETINREILTPIGLYILADKYEIAALLQCTSIQVSTALRSHKNMLASDAGDAIANIVAAYYNFCVRARRDMGKVIASGLVEHTSWMNGGDVNMLGRLVSTQPHFAADLVLAIRVSGLLRCKSARF